MADHSPNFRLIHYRVPDTLPNCDDKKTPWAEARIRNGLSLRAIADETMIGIRSLEAIEAGDFQQLLGGVYASSYIRQFAAAVGHDATEILAAYYRAIGSERSAS